MIFRNINSDTIEGLIICSEPPISSSGMKIKETTIDGRDGSIIDKLGYKPYTKTVDIGLRRNVDIDSIISFFSGEGDLTFSNEPNKVYKAAIYERIDLERLLRFRKGKVKFYCQPFKYNKNDIYTTVTNNVINQGNIQSKPLIRLEKDSSTSIELTVNGTRFKYTFPTDETYVEIDCESMTVMYEGLTRNRQLEIGYEFPRLAVGNNTITIHSGNATIKIKRKDRWL